MRKQNVCAAFIAALLVAGSTFAQVTKRTMAGVTNFAKLEPTIACAGATTPAAG